MSTSGTTSSDHENHDKTAGRPGRPGIGGAASRRTVLGSAAVGSAAVGSVLAGAGGAGAAGPRGPGTLPDTDAWPEGPGRDVRPQPADRELREILDQVDPDRIQAIVEKLASFGTRHTLSSQDDPERGIGAARDWIEKRMRRYALRSGAG